MPSVRDLRDRIRSLKNTQQITKAMKQVAAAKIRRAEAAQKRARPYSDAIGAMLRDLIANVGPVDHPYMKPGREGAPAGVILMTADKGLAGAFNANLVRAADLHQRADKAVVWYPVGVKARNGVRRLPQSTEQFWPINAASKLELARDVAQRVSADFQAGKISKIILISAKLVSMMSQKPETRQLIPIVRESQLGGDAPSGAVEFEPSPNVVLSRLLPKYLDFTIFSAILETDAAFFAAQLLAMNNATDNAKKLIDTLTVEMNNARQAAITKEILEIVGGAEALVS